MGGVSQGGVAAQGSSGGVAMGGAQGNMGGVQSGASGVPQRSEFNTAETVIGNILYCKNIHLIHMLIKHCMDALVVMLGAAEIETRFANRKNYCEMMKTKSYACMFVSTPNTTASLLEFPLFIFSGRTDKGQGFNQILQDINQASMSAMGSGFSGGASSGFAGSSSSGFAGGASGFSGGAASTGAGQVLGKQVQDFL